MTIQSSSPRTSPASLPGSVPRLAETAVSVAPSEVSRVLGRGGSSSRMIRRISSNAALRNRSRSNGVVPVSSSYSSTPEGVDVGPGVHVHAAHLGLLRAHVERRADHLGEPGVDRLLGQRLADRLGHAEVDHLRHRLAVVHRDQDVRRLEVAVDDPLLVGVLDRLADLHEQRQPVLRRRASARRSTR